MHYVSTTTMHYVSTSTVHYVSTIPAQHYVVHYVCLAVTIFTRRIPAMEALLIADSIPRCAHSAQLS